jgi:hypothetical protein
MSSPLAFEIQKDLLIKGWMSHDARWFMAVAQRFGIEEADQLNRKVCRDLGQVEMKRFMKALSLTLPKNLDEHMTMNKEAISLYGPDLIDYEIKVLDRQSYEMHIRRCFAHENVVKAGIKGQYVCGILARVQGWIDAQGLGHELIPPLGKCMKVQGKECRYILRLRFD